MPRQRRVTVIAGEELESQLSARFAELGASVYTSQLCRRNSAADDANAKNALVRIETVVSDEVADEILDFLHIYQSPQNSITSFVETVEVLQNDANIQSPSAL